MTRINPPVHVHTDLTCTNEADYLAKVREILNDLQRPTEELPGGLTPAQVENLEAYGMQRWRHRA